MAAEDLDSRRGVGPQSGSDDGFKKRMRLHQSWYRDRVLCLPYGTGPRKSSTTYYGNMLTERSAKEGKNFLTPEIFALAEKRIAEGHGVVEPFRLRRNMLASQPMCFNLFGELALDHDNATKLVRALWRTGAIHVTRVRFEWAPEPVAEYLNDRTAFDAFIEYETKDGQMGFIGIETKLSEPFSEVEYDREEYRRWMAEDSPWRSDASDKVSHTRHNQLWRDHLLAWAMLRHPDSKYVEGRLAVVYHPEDRRCREANRGIPRPLARRRDVFHVRSGDRGRRLEAIDGRMVVEIRAAVFGAKGQRRRRGLMVPWFMGKAAAAHHPS